MSESIIREKSFNFAVRIIKLSQYLQKQGDLILARQLLRSGTSIGANVREAKHAESRADFIHKMNIALKESEETGYWLDLLLAGGLLKTEEHQSIKQDADELTKILHSIVKTSKKKKFE